MDADAPRPTDVPTLHAMIRQLQAENRRLHARVAELEPLVEVVRQLRDEVATLKAQLAKTRFGRKSERQPRPTRTTPLKPRTKHGRAKLPAHLERRDVVIDLPPHQRGCPTCGRDRLCLESPPTEQLDCEPAVFFVRRTIRKTYLCQRCPETVPSEGRITTATPTTVGPIPKASAVRVYWPTSWCPSSWITCRSIAKWA